MKKILLKISFISLQFGFDILRPIKFFKGLPRYIKNYIHFKKNYQGELQNRMSALKSQYGGSGPNGIAHPRVFRLRSARRPVFQVKKI